MQWFLRLSRPVRGGLLAAAVVVALLVVRLFSGSTEETPSDSPAELEVEADVVQPAALEAAAAGVSWTIDDLGAPDDPLPGALPVPAIANPIGTAEAADTLALQVLAGTPESLPALITALQASGIGIVGPGNSSDAKPAEPWQGMAMHRWEVRTAAAMVLPDRSVSFTLADLASVLTAVVPQLQGAAVEELIVKDIRALAESPVPTRRFFGHFIAALGRQAVSHTPYDLLGNVDLQSIRIDGLQASLIVRRLSIDMLMLPGSKAAPGTKTTASFFDALDQWLVPTVYAQSQPCAVSDRAQTIADVAGLGTSVAWGGLEVGEIGMRGLMERLGLENLGNLAAFASTLLAYAQFIATYAALEAEVTMDRAPLVRTKKPSPQTGERRELTAIVKFNVGNAQMLNCFRTMLIAVGLDFSLPNNGPVAGARVAWYGVTGFDQAAAALHGGSEAIVQFVAPEESRIQGSGSGDASPITDAVTGEDGKIQIGVEGTGQRRNISNDATEVPKSAKVRLHVALKGADLFGDLQEAAGTAAGGLVGLATLPLSVLYRAQWATVGHYSFPVTDWRDGPAEWAGTITYTKVMVLNSSETFKGGNRAQDYRDALTLNVTITETLPSSDMFGSLGASMQGTAHAKLTGRNLRTGLQLVRCSNNPTVVELHSRQLDTSEGSGAGTARVSLGIAADGQYSITIHPEVMLNTRADYSGETQSLSPRCGVENRSSSSPTRTGSMPVSLNMQGDGRIDPAKPDRLTGRSEEKEGPTTETLTWDLQRR